MVAAARFDAVLLDAGGVLVMPDPTVLAPLLTPYGGSADYAAHVGRTGCLARQHPRER